MELAGRERVDTENIAELARWLKANLRTRRGQDLYARASASTGEGGIAAGIMQEARSVGLESCPIAELILIEPPEVIFLPRQDGRAPQNPP
jgi:hypothetical protein